MNNQSVKNFTGVPRTRWKRTRFTPKGSVKTSFNAGKLVPLVVQEVLPNTTMKLDLTSVVRGITPLAPVLDNAYCDVFAFFVPNRLSWEHWEDFLSEPAPRAYTDPVQYTVPQIQFNSTTTQYQGAIAGKFWDYAGVGAKSRDTIIASLGSVSALYPRGYVRIWNEWFRDQNVQNEAAFSTGDANVAYTVTGDPIVDAQYGASLLPVDKYKDYFTGALPQPQKGPPVSLSLSDMAVVRTAATPLIPLKTSGNSLQMNREDGSALASPGYNPLLLHGLANGTFFVNAGSTSSTDPPLGNAGYYPNNLYADLSDATAVTVNALRLAFQTQKFQERLARSGSRYTELLRSMFGVYATDARLQRSEFLGGRRFPITQHQVAQTAENDGTESIGLGDTGAFTFTADSTHRLVYRSFPEHGILYVLACVRTDQTYSQGIPVQFTRKNRFDFYFPTFAHIGEQPIYQREIYAGVSAADNDNVFGYKEPWVEYKYFQNRVTAKMRPYVNGNFGIWSYANHFASVPTLSPTFLHQDVANIDRTLAVSSTVQDQFFGDFYFDFKALDLPMPMYNEPGMVDHF